MADNKITVLIGQAIREGKYLNITYKNQNEEINPFWISILDINADDELYVNMFNVTKDDPIYDAKIYISRIQTAEILKFSHYDVPDELIRKINEDESLQKYHLMISGKSTTGLYVVSRSIFYTTYYMGNQTATKFYGII